MKPKYIITFALYMMMTLVATGQTSVKFHNEAADTSRINSLLAMAVPLANNDDRIAAIAQTFEGTPYVAHTLEVEPEQLVVNLDELDCTTFVETVMALAYTAGEGRQAWHDYLYNLERIRYRNGTLNGYASRLHYICDWAIDNKHRGNFKDVTPDFPNCRYLVRTIDYMSANRDQYPALADSAEFERIKAVELGYSNHRFPYIKSSLLSDKAVKKAFHDGDVVALVCKLKNLDVTHMGIIIKKDGEPYLLHASQSHGKVELTQLPLSEYMKKNPSLMGVRIFRM